MTSNPYERGATAVGEVWLAGDVLACGCPDCGAPMSVRIWLGLADCWRCGCSIELTDEQIRIGEALLDEKSRESIAPAPEERIEASPAPIPAVAPAPVEAEPIAPMAPSTASDDSLSDADEFSSLLMRLHWKNAPAWLVSMLFHILLLLLLALFEIGDDSQPLLIRLRTDVDLQARDGGKTFADLSPRDPTFDLPATPPKNASEREQLEIANQEARQLRIDPEAEKFLPTEASVRSALVSESAERRMLAARDPRFRSEIIRKEGGTLWTEAAVARGLHWLARHQHADGSWSLNRFHTVGDCAGRCGERGQFGKAAGTSLALLPFFGAGQIPSVPCRYRDEVTRGLRYLVDQQDPKSGALWGDSGGNSMMYVHAQATIVLCEAFAMTGYENLRAPAQKGVDLIVAAQHREGGWRYRPKEAGDTSVLGWQLMALQSARSATLTVPDETLRLAEDFLNSVESPQQIGLHGYMPGRQPTEAMTAEATLCRFYLGDRKNAPGARQAVEFLTIKNLPDVQRSNFYYWYYGTQALHHWGGPHWELWNREMRKCLLQTQELNGHEAGSWTPRDGHDRTGGRLYATSLAICTLEVYYRHAPIFRQIKLK